MRDSIALICLTILIVFFCGKPDVHDALIVYLGDCRP